MALNKVSKKTKKVQKENHEVVLNINGNNKLNFVDVVRSYVLENIRPHGNANFENVLALTDDYEKLETPEGFKITLLPHQKVVVKAMFDLEQKRYIKVNGLSANCPVDEGIIETCAGVLSDKLGSGKTYDILSLIAHSKTKRIPKTANITHIPLARRNSAIRSNLRNSNTFEYIGNKTEFRRIYKKFLPLSLIFVSKSVLLQWQKAIVENTNLKVFTISNQMTLEAFYKMLFKPTKTKNLETLLKYDIILIKNGNISGQFEPEEIKESPLSNTNIKKILSIFGELFKEFCFERVILDDFDTLGIPNNAYIIPALFTWFVSATKRCITSKCGDYISKNLSDAASNIRPSYPSVWKNRNLFTFFNIKCSEDFVDSSTKVSKVEFYTYKFHNSNEQYIGLLGAMGTEDAQLVMEALNGDAINTAAGNVGIKSTSVADIFEKVLENKWIIYKKNIEIENYISQVEIYISSLNANNKEKCNNIVLDKIRKNLLKPGPMDTLQNIIKYKEDEVDSVINEIKEENKSSKEENGKAIARVKDNLKQGDCPITCTPLIECAGVVIMKCCGVTISSEAAGWSLKFHKDNSKGNIAGICPNCRRQIEFSQLILIDKEVNIENILNDKIDIDLPTKQEEPEINISEPIEDLDKFACIIKIIKGEDHNNSEINSIKSKIDLRISGLLTGNYDYGYTTNENRKTIIFATYKETMENLSKKLIDNNIKFGNIQGTVNQIDDMVRRYYLPNSDKESISVLLIQGAQFCAGLNLQNTSDFIFTHKIIDKSVESQVIGRASRYGRTCNLRVHYVLYENELAQMFM